MEPLGGTGQTALLDFHGGDYVECRLLGCGAVWVYYKKTFWRTVSSHLQGLTCFLAHVISSTLKMEATRSSQMSVHKPTLCPIPENSIL
jgi:hypothetical protein